MTPLTPPNCDLKDFGFIPIEVTRFLDSSFNATLNDTAWRAGVTLWLKSWHQVPAASLPDDDATLANLSGLGRDIKTWRKIKAEAMRGWKLCDDARLYHPVVAEKALEAWLEKLSQRLSSGAGNATRWGAAFDPDTIERQIVEAAGLLTTLNPNSKALSKKRKKGTQKHPDGTPETHPDDIPTGSQETLKGQGRDIEGSRDLSKSLSPSGERAKSFSEFKAAYPQKDGLNAPEVVAEWNAAVDAGSKPQSILAGLAASQKAWDRDDRKYRPKAITWLTDKGWLDHVVLGEIKPVWAGPGEIRKAVKAELGEGFCCSYIDPSGWEDETIIPRTEFAAAKLKTVVCLRQTPIGKGKAA